MTAAALEIVWEAVTCRRDRHQQLAVLAGDVRTYPSLATTRIVRSVVEERWPWAWASLVLVDRDGRCRAASVIIDHRYPQPIREVTVL